jgi:hypothetical protein
MVLRQQQQLPARTQSGVEALLYHSANNRQQQQQQFHKDCLFIKHNST